MKQGLYISLLLTLISAILGVFHWWDYQKSLISNNRPSLEIRISENNQQLDVQIKSQIIEPGEYSLQKPSIAKDMNCFIGEKEAPCQKLTLKDQNTIELSYHISLTNSDYQYLQQWVPQLKKDGSILSFDVKLTVISPKHSNWYTYKEPIYSTAFEYINFDQWEMESDYLPLFKGTTSYETYSVSPNIFVLTTIPININPFQDFSEKVKQSQIFVVDPKLNSEQLNGLAILNSTEKRMIASSLLTSNLLDNNSSSNAQLIIDVLNTYFYSKSTDSNKAKFMVEELRGALTEEEKKQWHDMIYEIQSSAIPLEIQIDQSLKGLGKNTQFFQQNVKTNDTIPFFTFTPYELIVNGHNVNSTVNIIQYNNQDYLKLENLLKQTVLDMNYVNQNEILLIYNGHRIRYYPEQKQYIVDEHVYNYESELMVKIKDEWYIQINQLEKLLPIRMSIYNEQVVLFTDR